MTEGADGTSESAAPPPTAAGFDEGFAIAAASRGLRRVWQLADPDLPVEIEPFSFVSAALLDHVAAALGLSPGQTLVDLGCGRGGPGLWLARQAGAFLVGVDFSAVAIEQASQRAALFGLTDRARFVVGDLSATGLPDASADAVVSVDALHFAADLGLAAREVLRILRPGRPLVMTNWQPRTTGDPRLPSRHRDLNWALTLTGAGFVDVHVAVRGEWHDYFTGIYQIALSLGDPGDDVALANLQDEARQRLPTADAIDRVVATATRPLPDAAPST